MPRYTVYNQHGSRFTRDSNVIDAEDIDDALLQMEDRWSAEDSQLFFIVNPHASWNDSALVRASTGTRFEVVSS